MNLLGGPPSNLCVSAFNGHFNAEAAKIRRAPQRKRIKFATFCAKQPQGLDCYPPEFLFSINKLMLAWTKSGLYQIP